MPARKLARRPLAPSWLNIERSEAEDLSGDAYGYIADRDVLRRQSVDRMTVGLPHLLRYDDRNSMAFSIESRVPFLTPELAQLILNLPEEYVVSDRGESKSVFRDAMRGMVPDAILDRQDKIGFTTPTAWLRELEPWVERVLSSDVARNVGVLNVDTLRTGQREMLANRSQSVRTGLWRALNLVEWARIYEVTIT